MSDQPIIIKRIKKGGHAAHGGSWKVAYADFMTAMMAFFLLLWLLNSVTEEQLLGISNYFAPIAPSASTSGSGGVLGGQVIGEGNLTSKSSSIAEQLTLPPSTVGSGGSDFTDPNENASEKTQETDATKAAQAANPTAVTDKQNMGLEGVEGSQSGKKTDQQIADELQDAEFEKRAEEIRQALNNAAPSLAALSKNLLVDNTPEGLRIQLVDQDGLTMFDRGSARLLPHTEQLMALIVDVVKDLPNKIAIVGHTDSTPYSNPASYDNWDLSSDRAQASRRTLVRLGMDADRVSRVEGKASTEPLRPENPQDPSNRRIAITLLRDSSQFLDQAKAIGRGEIPPPEGIKTENTPPANATPAPPASQGGATVPPSTAPQQKPPPATPLPSILRQNSG